MQIETAIGLCTAVVFSSAAYFDYKGQKYSQGNVTAGNESLVVRSLERVVLATIVAILCGGAAYLFSQLPVRMWEMAGAIVIGSLMLRLFSRLSRLA